MRKVSSRSFQGHFKTISEFYIPILLIVLVIAAASILVFLTRAQARERASATNISQPSPTPETLCCGQEQDAPHFLAASYYNVGHNLTATLMLNNKGPEPVEVKPTLFSLSGERLDAAPIIVAGESFRNIDLKELGALPGTLFEEGSLQLFHKGADLVIGAQLYLVDETHSLSFDEKLVEFQTVPSTQLESVWWVPSRQARVSLILSNTSADEISVNAVINAGTPHSEAVDVTLSPHETRVIKAQREKPGKGERLRDDVGSASIHHAGAKGSLVARALIEDESTGYSFSAQFYYPQGGKSSGY
jgi:P pilus assembly chaperone PapD